LSDSLGPPLVVITGPTASGKSSAALALAERGLAGRAIEVVSVDSAQVYRGMDVGTAKPSSAERGRVPHHLVDLIDPAESYSAARFVADADAAVDAIRARGRVPVLVGGTMLYLKALAEGLDDMPTIAPAIRAEIAREAATEGWVAMHGKLAAVDPEIAARLAPLDAQRISRALEVWRGSGMKLSSLQRAKPATRAHRLVLLSLETTDRTELHQRIARRFDAMLAVGLIDEVKQLKARGDLHDRMPSMRCVGYRQVWEFLDGVGDEAEMRERAIAATRQLAKRQMTWLRSMPERTVVDCLSGDAAERIAGLAAAALAG
jgi:tRNA dimethylallyltransferase